MGETEKEGRVFRKPRWAPGQEERARANAARLMASGKTVDELVASGDLIPAGTMGEFVAASYAAYQKSGMGADGSFVDHSDR